VFPINDLLVRFQGIQQSYGGGNLATKNLNNDSVHRGIGPVQFEKNRFPAWHHMRIATKNRQVSS
jgi:hypothetical protein